MPISFISNPAADHAHSNMQRTAASTQRAMTAVSSGTRVFSAKEDSAALSISSGLRVDTTALRAAQINVSEGMSALQIADGALAQISEVVNRMKSLATQAASGQLSPVELTYLNNEFVEMREEMTRIAESTNFNGAPLLGGETEILPDVIGANVDVDNGFVGYEFDDFVDSAHNFEIEFVASTSVLTLTNPTTGISQTLNVETPAVGQLNEYTFSQLGVTLTLNSNFDASVDMPHLGPDEEVSVQAGATAAGATFEYQVGRTTNMNDRISVDMPVVTLESLGLSMTNLSTPTAADLAMEAIESASEKISDFRASMGAYMNRLEVASNNIQLSIENSESARSALIDADVAVEITTVTANEVLMQAATDILGRANQRPEQLLELLR